MNQTRRNPDRLHHEPDNSAAALLLIDVINDLEFEGGEALLPSALKMATALSAFKRRAKEQGIPVIYANDNFGRWRSDFPKLVEHCSREEARGREIVIQLNPEDDDLCSQTQALGIFSDQPGNSSRVPRRLYRYPHRNGRGYLRTVQRERRLHA